MEVRAHRRDWDSEPVVAFPVSVSEACTTMGAAALQHVFVALDAPCVAQSGDGPEAYAAFVIATA
jgi:NAD(P)H-dependent FMN reductase